MSYSLVAVDVVDDKDTDDVWDFNNPCLFVAVAVAVADVVDVVVAMMSDSERCRSIWVVLETLVVNLDF